jgi:pyrroline-5-carboxylate reductase
MALAGPLLLVGCGKMGGALLRGWLPRPAGVRTVVVGRTWRRSAARRAGVVAVADPRPCRRRWHRASSSRRQAADDGRRVPAAPFVRPGTAFLSSPPARRSPP